MPIYDKGDNIRLVATFVDLSNVVLDPASVYFKILTPARVIATYVYGGAAASVIKAGVGAYYVDYTPTQGGDYTFRFESGAGSPGQAAGDAVFNVNFTPF